MLEATEEGKGLLDFPRTEAGRMRTRRGYRPKVSTLETRLALSATGFSMDAHARETHHRTPHLPPHHAAPHGTAIHTQVIAGGAFTPGHKILPIAVIPA